MPNDSSAMVSKLLNYPPLPSGLRRPGARGLKNAGGGYGDYAEQHHIIAKDDELISL